MKLRHVAAVSAILAAACSGGDSRSAKTLPANAVGDEPSRPAEPETLDSGTFKTFLAGKEESRERFTVKRRDGEIVVESTGTSSYGTVLWESVTRYDPSWQILGGRLEVLSSPYNDRACTTELVERDGAFSVELRQPDGSSRRVAGPEPKERVQLSLGMEPITSQLSICWIAGEARTVGYFPGFTAKLSAATPRAFKSMPGEAFTAVVVDDLIDVVCRDGKLVLFHYNKHAFTAVRAGFEAIATEISADDPTDDPFHGRISCPEPAR